MGKAIFMNCDFTKFKVIFLSSKIIEIFLANTSFPPIADENYRTFAGIYDYEQKITLANTVVSIGCFYYFEVSGWVR